MSYQNSTDTASGMAKQSMFGGAPIFIRSNGGFDDMPAQN